MLKIETTVGWDNFVSIYGAKDIRLRYQWFLFEFGKRSAKLFYKHLMQQLSTLEGTSAYRRSLSVAEIKDSGKRAWWAIVSSAKPIGNAQYDPKTSIFIAASRFTNVEKDPVREILEAYGPWTVETIPFVPSSRAGQIVLKNVTEDEVTRVRETNIRRGEKIKAAMSSHGISFEPRQNVYQKLRVIEDIEANALRIEFGLAEKSKPHWRPSIRWLRKQGMQKMEKEKDLIRLWFDPKFVKYRSFRHLRVKLTQGEIKRIQNFQDKVRI